MLLQVSLGAAGALVWQPSARDDAGDILLGRPLVFSEYCKALGTQGDIVLANWGEYLEGDYQPMMSDESISVRFERYERAFRFVQRNAGAGWWKSPLTPKYSTKTLSPFVVCDTRA
jgi:HK97 family phage major capsid protein